MGDKKLREAYFDDLKSEVKKLRKMSKEDFQSLIDSKISSVFENAYLGRLNNMFEKSREA